MAGMVWITDREPGVRMLFGDLLPEAEVLTPDELHARLGSGQRPDAIVIDGTQLLEVEPARRRTLLSLPRVLICTGLPLASIPMNLISGPGVAVLGKPFCVEDLEAAVEWVRGVPAALPPERVEPGTLARRRPGRSTRGRVPAR